MILEIQEPMHISHPLIESAVFKKDTSNDNHDNILVIHLKDICTKGSDEEKSKILMDVLASIDLIKDEAEQKSGPFARIDICQP